MREQGYCQIHANGKSVNRKVIRWDVVKSHVCLGVAPHLLVCLKELSKELYFLFVNTKQK